MKNELHIFKNDLFEIAATLEDGQVLFDAEMVARNLGFTTVAKSGNETVRWSRVNEYLGDKISQRLAKGDLIPEPLVYKLAFKASNETAEKFQDWLAIEVIPQIRKTGSYQKPMCLEDILIAQLQEMKNMKVEVAEAKQEIQDIRDVIVINPKAEWRTETNNILKVIGKSIGDYSKPRHEVYEALKTRANCRPNVLVNNLKKRALENGMAPSKADKFNLLDVLENDPRLREIYIAIVKEMAIKYNAV